MGPANLLIVYKAIKEFLKRDKRIIKRQKGSARVGKLKRTFLLITLSFILTLLFGYSASAATSLTTDCSKCHGTKVSEFNTLPLDKTKCKVCHSVVHGLADPFEGGVSTLYGRFASSQSINASSTFLHSEHNAKNAGIATNASCSVCHSVAQCTACHSSVPHITHSSTKYQPVYIGQANGITNSYQNVSCATAYCHQPLPNVTKVRTDGTQLCINCHSTDKSGHTQASLDFWHGSSTSSLTVNGTVYNNLTCTGCHSTTLAGEHKNVAVKLGQTDDAECGYCHMASAQESVKNTVTAISAANAQQTDAAAKLQNRACTECHFNSNVLSSPPQHITYHVANLTNNLSIVGGPHATCDTCHAKQQLWPTISGMIITKTYGCLDCHNGNSNPQAPRHIAEFNGQATGLLEVHSDCTYCHTPGSDYAAKVDSSAAALKADPSNSYSCTDCHTNLANSHNAYYQFGTETINLKTTKYHRSCAVCHGNAKVSGVVKLLKGSTTAYNCNQCHNSTAAKLAIHTTASSEAIVGYHPADATGTRCDKCHGEANFAKIDIPTWPVNYQCTNCHNGTIAKTALHQAKDASGRQYTTTSLHPTCGACHDSAESTVQSVISTNRGTSVTLLND